MLKNRKSISAFAVVAALLLSISAPTLSTAAKTPPVQLKSPQNIVVTPVAPGGNFTVSWSVVPYASSYTVRVYNSSGKTLVGSAITSAVSVQTVTKSANTSYRVTVQAIGNGSTYSNSPESGKYSVTTFASTYAITWNDQSPTTASSGGSTTYTTGSAVTTIRTVVPTKTGYSFGGWFTQTAGTGTQVTNGTYTPASPYGAVTFYAKWIANTNNAITWDHNGGASVTAGPTTYTTATSIGSLPVTTTKDGYTFDGWWVDSTFATGSAIDGTYTPASPYGAVTFYAKWIANTNNAITWNHNGGASVTAGPTTYTTATSIGSLPVTTTKDGYTFDGWWVDSTFATGSAIDGTYTPASPYGAVTFYAKWIANTNNAITWDHNGGASVTAGPTTYTTATSIGSLPVTTTKDGYTFDGWWVDSTFATGSAIDGTYTPASPYGAVTFYAKWIANTNNAITWNHNGGASVTAGPTTYTTATSIGSLPVTTTKDGYTFDGWWVDSTFATGSAIDGTYTPASPYGAVTFYAKWIANTNNAITWNHNGGASVTAGPTTYTTATSIGSLPVTTTKDGYTFDGWWVDSTFATGSAIDGTYTPASPYGAVTFYAKWLPD